MDGCAFRCWTLSGAGQRRDRATRHSRTHFAPDSWGGYLIYRLYPQNKVFVDDRHDLYGEEFLKEYLKAIRLTPDWNGFLEEKQVNWALLPAESSLANMLKETSRWNLVYQDGTSVLLERKEKI